MKRIFIVEDEIVVASGIKDILENNGYEVTGIATNYKAAKEKLLITKNDLILCDINLGESRTGIDLMREIKGKYNLPFIFISAYTSLDIIEKANKTEPINYITKPFNENQLLVSIKRAIATLNSKLANFEPTEREKHIIQLLANGLSSKDIAGKLSLSYYTVETHRKKLVKKFNVKNVNELISKAMSNQWVTYQSN